MNSDVFECSSAATLRRSTILIGFSPVTLVWFVDTLTDYDKYD